MRALLRSPPEFVYIPDGRNIVTMISIGLSACGTNLGLWAERSVDTPSGQQGCQNLNTSSDHLVLLEIPKHITTVLHRQRVVAQACQEHGRCIVDSLVQAHERPEVMARARVDSEQLLVRDVDIQTPRRIHLHVRMPDERPEAVPLRELTVVDSLVRGPRVRVEVLGVDAHLVPWDAAGRLVGLDDDEDVLGHLNVVRQPLRPVARVAREVADGLLGRRVRLGERR